MQTVSYILDRERNAKIKLDLPLAGFALVIRFDHQTPRK
jgi:hypothetical protein